MPKPTDTFPNWCSDEGNFAEPDPSRLVAGWDTNQIPPSAEQNWWQRVVSKWVSYLNGIHAEDFVSAGVGAWSGNHSFEGDQFSMSAAEAFLTGPYVEMDWREIIRAYSGDFSEEFTHANHRAGFYVIGKGLYWLQNATWTGTQFDRLESGKDAFLFSFGNFDSASGFPGIGFQLGASPSADGDSDLLFKYHWDAPSCPAGQGQVPVQTPINVGTAGGGTYTNSWADIGGGGSLTVNKDPFGTVRFSGGITGGTSAANVSTQPLPAYLRPPVDRVMMVWGITAAAPSKVTVFATGHIQITHGGTGNFYFDGLSYR